MDDSVNGGDIADFENTTNQPEQETTSTDLLHNLRYMESEGDK